MFCSFVVPLLPHLSDKLTSLKGNRVLQSANRLIFILLFTEHGLLVFSICVGKEDTHSQIYCEGNRARSESDGQRTLGTPPKYKVQPTAPTLRIWKDDFRLNIYSFSHFLTFKFWLSVTAREGKTHMQLAVFLYHTQDKTRNCGVWRVGPLPGWNHEVWPWHKRATVYPPLSLHPSDRILLICKDFHSSPPWAHTSKTPCIKMRWVVLWYRPTPISLINYYN